MMPDVNPLRAALLEIEEAVNEAHTKCEKQPMACGSYHSFALGVVAAVAWRALHGGDDDA